MELQILQIVILWILQILLLILQIHYMELQILPIPATLSMDQLDSGSRAISGGTRLQSDSAALRTEQRAPAPQWYLRDLC